MHTCRGSGHLEAPLATSCTRSRSLSLSFFCLFLKLCFVFKFCTFLKSIYNCWFCAERAHLRLLRGGDGQGGVGGGDGAAGGAGEVGREAEGQVPAGGPCGRWEGSWRWFSESQEQNLEVQSALQLALQGGDGECVLRVRFRHGPQEAALGAPTQAGMRLRHKAWIPVGGILQGQQRVPRHRGQG